MDSMDKDIRDITTADFGLKDYRRMFDLSADDLNLRILDCQGIHTHFSDDLKAVISKSTITACDPTQLPKLPYDNEQFELALVSHYLFTLTENQSLAYHIASIEELVRVANEVRIFPLVNRAGVLSSLVGDIVAQLQSDGFGVELRAVPYEIQPHGNAMLRIWAPECHLEAHKAGMNKA